MNSDDNNFKSVQDALKKEEIVIRKQSEFPKYESHKNKSRNESKTNQQIISNGTINSNKQNAKVVNKSEVQQKTDAI